MHKASISVMPSAIFEYDLFPGQAAVLLLLTALPFPPPPSLPLPTLTRLPRPAQLRCTAPTSSPASVG